ncbi:receptor-type tyrosine-protein phosphatase T-like [Penaeus japonicus]|uniref:receptor-type tyrosine-protein phosphatase T-like n=1 Tax=Penaeus japonicus TaxID=27405 RepID=UPI001C710174|nr:receptor-type tyrosine-protein phosphatase T-like [Penaeus japonicus]
MGHSEKSEAPTRVVFTFDDSPNYHALICQGRRPATDVLAVVQFWGSSQYTATYVSPASTFRASKGETLDIPLDKTDGMPSHVFLKKFPESWTTNTPNWTLPLTFRSAQPYHKAVYNAGNSKEDDLINDIHSEGAYFDIIIRDCQAQKYGPDCSSDCPVCHNGGQCHSQTGTCVCPPGYYGTTCQHACLPGRFGSSCQLSCRTEAIGFTLQNEKKCSGLTFCVPAPYGCSCAPGYSGPFCAEECSNGTYGVNCQGRCRGCSAGGCHPVTGTCSKCKPGSPCTIRPPAPANISVAVAPRGLNITWQQSGDPEEVYFVTYQKVSCARLSAKEEEKHTVTSTARVELKDLEVFTRYNVCVVASRGPEGGHSEQACIQPFTAPSVSAFSCTGGSIRATCSVSLGGECKTSTNIGFTMSVVLKTYVACNKSILVQREVFPERSGTWKQVTLDVVPGQMYNASLVIATAANQIVAEDEATFKTDSGRPPPVRDLTAGLVCPTQVQLFWNDPCPSHGPIDYFFIQPGGMSAVQPCESSSEYQRCHVVNGLALNKRTEITVQVVNGQWSDGAYVNITTMENRPGTSRAVATSRNPRAMTLAIRPPIQPGGVLLNCSLSIQGTNHKCTKEFNRNIAAGDCPPPISEASAVCPKFTGLTEGKLYKTETWCCNSKFCSVKSTSLVATTPLPPALSTAPSVQESSNTTITIALPVLARYEDGNSSMAVVIQRIPDDGGESIDLQASAIALLEGRLDRGTVVNREVASRSSRGRREVRYFSDAREECQESLRIAALLTEDDSSFVIGDGQVYNGFLNCPLESQMSYQIGVLARNDLLGERRYAWEEVDGIVRAREWKPTSNLAILITILVLLVLLIVALAFVMYRYPNMIRNWKSAFIKDHQENSLVPQEKEVSFHDISSPVDNFSLSREVTGVFGDPLYENIYLDEIYSNGNRRVSRLSAEAYLNRIIGSREAAEEFKTIPENADKKMDVGNLPDNRKKNRYRNNRPYDDTRVKLSVKNGVPTSDYINANHITSHGQKMRYIATQGPKQNTIGDFWRMVWEQNVSAIIMVANFIENEKEKVAQYISIGSNLETEEMTVSVLSRESLPHFILSRISLLSHDGQQREIWHYQFISWPDHGVPGEALSLASMVRHFRASQPQGVTVVHCSAGIGRTGTVLLVSLMLDGLDQDDSMDPIEDLAHLRNCRARLVETYAQYDLALQILDEILFGTSTNVLSASLLEELPRLLLECPNQFRKLKALPSALAYRVAEQQDVYALTRNHAAFPSDTKRVCLTAEEGILESQYINAIKVTGLTNSEALLVTEHPLISTTERFWRLVIEKFCPMVVFLNEYLDKDEFPAMLPNQDEESTFGRYRVQTHAAQQYSHSLLQARVTITNPQNETYSVVVYQVTGWKYGKELPPSTDILITLADLLLQVPRGPYLGPPLLCCGDGVTGCGLVAAVMLVLERAINHQSVDIYRTAVMLLRCRSQFITTLDQYSTLYDTASSYLENFSTYSNIS